MSYQSLSFPCKHGLPGLCCWQSPAPRLPKASIICEISLSNRRRRTGRGDVSSGDSSFKRRDVLNLGLLGGIGIFQVIKESESIAGAVETACELTEAPSGLAFCDRVVGTGPQAVKGQLVKAHYVGKLESGKVFDSSYNRGQPLIFRVGVGEVIKGWDEGIIGNDGVPPMLAGGKRVLRIPPELGYGMRGAGCRGGSCVIPPDSVLFFEVELLK